MNEQDEAKKRAGALGIAVPDAVVAADFLAAVTAMDAHVRKLPRDLPPSIEPAVKLGFL